MGPQKTDRQLVALIAEKDTEIKQLRKSLAAHIAHATATNSRLTLALDTLDSVQCDHALELAAEIQAKERLRDTLTRYLDIVKVAEIERDDLRDAVIELAEKIELCKNDFTSWSHSRLRIQRLLEPLHTMPNDWSRLISEHDLWAYASGMITFLRDSLASERRAHAETRTAARARTALLEAQIARRDAELEACLFHTGQTFPRASGSRHAPPNIPVLSPSPPPIPTADVDNALHLTVAQNVALEEELEHLAVVLEQGRVGAHRFVPPSVTRRTGLESAIPDVFHQAPARPSDPGRRKRDRQASHPRDAKQRRSRSGSRARQRHSSSPRSEVGDPDRTIRPDVMHAVRSAPENMHASLDREIAVLGAKIDEFQIEKQVLLAQVQAEAEPSPVPAQVSSNVRLHSQQYEHHPSRPVPQTGRSPQAQPQTRLPLLPSSRPPIQSLVGQSLPEAPVSGPGRLLEDNDGEMSMDLATPLVPTVMLPLAGPSNWVFNFPPMRTPPIVSTEISPLDLSSDCPLPGAPSPPDGTDTQTWGGRDVRLQPGEQAVQELMDIAARRRGS